MAEIINLNRVRKARTKVEAKASAAANRAAHGRTRQARDVAETERDRAARLLDGAKRDQTPED